MITKDRLPAVPPLHCSRRVFLGGAGAVALGALLAKAKAQPTLDDQGNLYRRLLDQWCRAMLPLQIRNRRPALDGGLLCPACARVHGRSADAVYPFLSQARLTGESRFVDAAVRVMAWSDNVSEPSGAFLNDPPFHDWRGITVFAVIALAEALAHHSDLLDTVVRERWRSRLRKAADFLVDFPDLNRVNINYTTSGAAALAYAATIFEGDKRYAAAARALVQEALRYFLPESRLLFGEGGAEARSLVSPRGCRAVDIGYNVEESLPNLLSCARLLEDKDLEDVVAESMVRHLDFMIPDGAWDCSFSSRMFKWAYWGSRTSDGCQLAYGRLAARDPRFAEAAYRNAQLLERCTHEGLLHAGPHHHAAGEAPCLHHTFCHAKAIAAMVDENVRAPAQRAALPRDEAYGIRSFPELLTHLLADGSWRATVTAYDEHTYMPEVHPSGGALSLLWHRAIGPVFMASMTEYALIEKTNQQRDRAPRSFSLTPRLEQRTEGAVYRNLHDLNATIATERRDASVAALAGGRLLDKSYRDPASGRHLFELRYEIGENVTITASVTGPVEAPVHLVLPVISPQNEAVRARGDTVEIGKDHGLLRIKASHPIALGPEGEQRVFNHVPGMQALPLFIELPRDGGAVQVEIAVIV